LLESSESLLQPFQEKIASPVQLRVLIIMKHWLDKHFYDFEDDDELRKTLEKWVDDVATKKNPGISKQLKKLISKNNSKKQEKVCFVFFFFFLKKKKSFWFDFKKINYLSNR